MHNFCISRIKHKTWKMLMLQLLLSMLTAWEKLWFAFPPQQFHSLSLLLSTPHSLSQLFSVQSWEREKRRKISFFFLNFAKKIKNTRKANNKFEEKKKWFQRRNWQTKRKKKNTKRFVAESETKIDVTKMYSVSRIERLFLHNRERTRKKNRSNSLSADNGDDNWSKILFTDSISSWKVNFIATQSLGVFPLAGLSYFYLDKFYQPLWFTSMRVSLQENSSRRKR